MIGLLSVDRTKSGITGKGFRAVGDDEPLRLWALERWFGLFGHCEVNGKAYTQGYSNGKNTLFCVACGKRKNSLDAPIPLRKSTQIFSVVGAAALGDK